MITLQAVKSSYLSLFQLLYLMLLQQLLSSFMRKRHMHFCSGWENSSLSHLPLLPPRPIPSSWMGKAHAIESLRQSSYLSFPGKTHRERFFSSRSSHKGGVFGLGKTFCIRTLWMFKPPFCDWLYPPSCHFMAGSSQGRGEFLPEAKSTLPCPTWQERRAGCR